MKKVGELYNIPIVEGDPNLLTNNQLLYKDGILSRRASTGDIENLGNSSGGGGSNIKYFKHNNGEMAEYMVVELGMAGGLTIKWKDTDDTIRFEYGNSYALNVDTASIQTSQRFIGALAVAIIDAPVNIFINDRWEEQNFVEDISQAVEAGALIEITEEEFYNTTV